MNSVTRPVTGLFASPGNASASQAKITALAQRVVRLRAELWLARLDRSDWAQLQHLLQLAGHGRYRLVAATVTAAGPAYQDTVTMDAGHGPDLSTLHFVARRSGSPASANATWDRPAAQPAVPAGYRRSPPVAGHRAIAA